MYSLCKMIIFYIFSIWLFGFVLTLPHPIQDADNSTKCEFAFIPTGYLTVGKTISVPGECMVVTCQEDLTITGLTCPTYFAVPGCYFSEVDRYKDYPACCPEMICEFTPSNMYLTRRKRAQRRFLVSRTRRSN
ncbi:hypothetical protein ILUMI_24785 [Ignelater luminosus]|uniref:Single domain-containing protein n=1 Tax=Ignelater luminosus TaxID=2038154 RepID=A0A8K0C9U1_IGNLU|nr:hypothetical protein ILUMI_24785 [Ignelater luminosus]